MLPNKFFNDYLLPGVPVNAAWDLIKFIAEKANQKSLEKIYLDAFQQALEEYRSGLKEYATKDGEIGIDNENLLLAIEKETKIGWDELSLRAITDKNFVTEIAPVLAKLDILIIGGHQLGSEQYNQFVTDLIESAHKCFKKSILDNEQGFNKVLLEDIKFRQEFYQKLPDQNKQQIQLLTGQQSQLESIYKILHNIINKLENQEKAGVEYQQENKPEKVKIYVAAPGDVIEEKRRIERVIKKLRNRFTDRLGVNLELLDSHNCDRLEDYDIFIGILWLHFEDDTGENQSGTEEEFKAVCDYLKQENIGWRQGIIYRCSRKFSPDYLDVDDNFDAYNLIRKFWNSLKKDSENVVEIQEYNQPEDLEISIYDRLETWLWELIPTPAIAIPGIRRPDLDFRQYYRAIQTRYEILDLKALTPPKKDEFIPIQLRSVFVEQEVREDKPPLEIPKELSPTKLLDREDLTEDSTTDIKFDLEEFLRQRQLYTQKSPQPVLDAIAQHKYIVILGDPGSGKSTLARYVLLSLINPTEEGNLQIAFDNHLPLLVELREYVGYKAENKCKTFLELFEYLGETQGWSLTKTGLEQYLTQGGQAVIIFDGLDEIFNSRDRQEVMRQIVGFKTQHSQVKVIVTSRIVGYDETILKNAGFAHFTLQDLEKEQVEIFIDRWYGIALSDRPDEAEERRDKVMTCYKESASIRLLAGNPMLLTIMAIIGKHQELPRERWELYAHAASVLIQHWDVRKQLEDENEKIDPDLIREREKNELLRRLAYRMQKGARGLAGNYIGEENIQAEFRDYFQEKFAWESDRATKIANVIIEKFRSRNFILCLYGGNYVYGFVHRAFLEYFCAFYFVHRLEKIPNQSIENLLKEVYKPHWRDENWHEVMRLICSSVGEGYAGKIIDYLVEEVNPNWLKEDLSKQPINIALALECFGEIRDVSLASKSGEKLLEAIFSLFFDPRLPHNQFLRGDRVLFLEDKILPTLKSIDLVAPLLVTDWLRNFELIETSWKWERVFLRDWAEDLGRFIGIVGSKIDNLYPIILSWLEYSDRNYQILAVSALAEGWCDREQIFPLLQQLARENIHQDVRNIAIDALGKNFSNRIETFPLLQQLAREDIHENIRRSAIYALAKNYGDRIETFLLLQQLTGEDTHKNIRRSAIYALVENFGNRIETFHVLQQASENTDPYIRDSAINALIRNHTNRPETFPFLQQLASQDLSNEDVRRNVIKALAENYAQQSETLPFLQKLAREDTNKYVRSSAIYALAENFSARSETFPLLLQQAKEDTDRDARNYAINALVEHYGDRAETFTFLQQLIREDIYSFIAGSAINALAKNYSDRAETFTFLQQLIREDRYSFIAGSAINALAENYRERSQTFTFLQQLAREDIDSFVRNYAIKAILEHFHQQPEILTLLIDKATTDKDAKIRYSAIFGLIEYFRDDSYTLEILKDRVLNDESPASDANSSDRFHVRELCLIALANLYSTHPGILPLLEERKENEPVDWLRQKARALCDRLKKII